MFIIFVPAKLKRQGPQFDFLLNVFYPFFPSLQTVFSYKIRAENCGRNKIYFAGAVVIFYFAFRLCANAFLIRSVRSALSGGKPSKSRLGLTPNAWLIFAKVGLLRIDGRRIG
jgi:hypothetical protein